MRALMRTSLPMRFLMAGLAALCLQLLLMLQGAVAAGAVHQAAVVSADRPGVQTQASFAGGRASAAAGHDGRRHCLAEPGRACCDRQHDVARHVIWRPGARFLPRPKGKGLAPGEGAAGQSAPAFLSVDDFPALSAGRVPLSLAFDAGWHGRGLLHLCCRLLI